MFTFNGLQLRGIKIDGEPWFVAKDVIICLGLTVKNVTAHLSKLDEDEKGLNPIKTPGGVQQVRMVSRPGLFKLVQRSDKPEAREFDRWVRHEVLPQIMDNGEYVTKDADVETVIQAA